MNYIERKPSPPSSLNLETFGQHQSCTDEILISDVNSYKNSLAIIYMYLKMFAMNMHVNFNFISIHVAQVLLSNVPPCPSPCLSYSF